MKALERIHGYLTVGKQRVAIRSKTVADKIQRDRDTIEQLEGKATQAMIEKLDVEARLRELERKTWVRIGRFIAHNRWWLIGASVLVLLLVTALAIAWSYP